MMRAKTSCTFVEMALVLLLGAGWGSTAPRGLGAVAHDALERHEFEEVHMGVKVRVALYAPDEQAARRAKSAAFDRIAALDRAMSDYDSESELSRLSRTAPSAKAVPVSDDLWRVLQRSQAVAAESSGAFDVTVGPYVRLWRRARRTGQLPSAERMAEARDAVGYQHLVLDPATKSVRLLKPNMRLDLGGIGMGYAVDEALLAMRKLGISRAMIDASGDVGVGDPPPGAAGWRIGIAPLEPKAPPSRYALLANAAVTTSGDAFQHVEIGGRRYSHIVDPKTGLGLSERSSVTVIASDCITADSLATAACVLGPTEGMKLIERTKGAAALIVRAEGQAQQVHESKRLGGFLAPR